MVITGVRVTEALSYTHRREHVEYVIEAKRNETRARRVRATVERLTGGA